MKKSIAFGVVVSLAITACAPVDRQTQITVGLSSETVIPEELDRITIRVTGSDGQLKGFSEYDASSGLLRNSFFPGTAAIIPVDEDSLRGPLTIELSGFSGGVEQLKRRSRLSYVSGRNITVPMPLRMACFKQQCEKGKTCSGGRCVEELIKDSTILRDYKESELIGDLGAECFREEECLPEAESVAVLIEPTKKDPSPFDYSCDFQVPADNANVAIRWQAAPNRVIVLDEGDEMEGWIRTGPTSGKLAQGLCASYADPNKYEDPKRAVTDRALDIAVTRTCKTKTGKIPYCTSSARVAGSGVEWKKKPAQPDYSPRRIGK
jgi:hypothetical protein